MGPTFIILISVAVFVGIFIFLYFIPLGLWFTAWASGVKVGLIQLIVMRIRKVPPREARGRSFLTSDCYSRGLPNR